MTLLWHRANDGDNSNSDEKKNQIKNRVQIACVHFALCEKNAVSIALFSKLFFSSYWNWLQPVSLTGSPIGVQHEFPKWIFFSLECFIFRFVFFKTYLFIFCSRSLCSFFFHFRKRFVRAWQPNSCYCYFICIINVGICFCIHFDNETVKRGFC